MTTLRERKDVRTILNNIANYKGQDLDLLSRLVLAIRPNRKQIKFKNFARFEELIDLLRKDERLREGFKSYLIRLIKNQKISTNLTDSNIISGTDFWRELKNRLVYKILPYQPTEGSIEYLLVNVFYSEKDGEWVSALDEKLCTELLEILGFQGLYEREMSDHLLQEILFAARVLSHRITGNAFDIDVLRMVPEYANFESPFAALQDEIDTFLNGFLKGEVGRGKKEIHFKHLNVLISQCHDFIDTAYRNKEKYGISFRVHQQLMLMERLLERLRLVLDFITIDEAEGSKEKLVKFIKTLIYFNSGKTMIGGYINKSTQLMAREITQHIGKKGEHYITNSKSEYWKMFRTALGGGAIVAFACIFKMKFAEIDASLFGKAFLYSMNYAFAFIGIYLMHYTLATKQPAMTAAKLAQVIEEDLKRKEGFEKLAELVAKVFRSQFIAFVGNVVMAFPVALGFVFLWGLVFDVNMAQKKADILLTDINLLETPVIFHSAIAGVFLFISGLIAGNISNRTMYRRVPDRIKQHPTLKLFLSENIRSKIAGYYERNMGGILSNLWFGIFMGTTSTVGIILGLNLDIRHITFAAGNFGLGLYGMDFMVSWETVFISLFGIGIIGFTNFIVSFTLSLLLALRSRGVPFREMFSIFTAVRRHFIFHPNAYFFPPKESEPLVENLEEKAKKAPKFTDKKSADPTPVD